MKKLVILAFLASSVATTVKAQAYPPPCVCVPWVCICDSSHPPVERPPFGLPPYPP